MNYSNIASDGPLSSFNPEVNYDRSRIPPARRRWLAAYSERNRLSRLIQQNSAAMTKIKIPRSVLRLDDLADQTRRIEENEKARLTE